MAAPVAAQGISQPNATIYVSNIDWKIKKPLLRRALYSLFSRHGKVLEVIALRKEGLRGQAWIIFNDIQSATAALQAEQGFNFFSKDLKLQYAREKSDRIAKRDGTYIPKAKRKKLVPPVGESNSALASASSQQQQPQQNQQVGETIGETRNESSETTSQPSHILFAENLPAECNQMMLAMLFRQYSGYKEVRMPREGLAFIEYEDEPRATLALQALNGFKLTTNEVLNLKYGKA